MREAIQLVAKITGVVSGVGACASWSVAMWMPSPALPLSGVAIAVALFMAVLAIIAVIASVRGHGITLIVLFFASFFPIGLFLLGIPGWVRVIGVLNLGYLIAGLVAWRMPRVIERSESSAT
ncbi:MAG: hypothetical protein V3R65_09235 [Acidiferrobacterales bacterium]